MTQEAWDKGYACGKLDAEQYARAEYLLDRIDKAAARIEALEAALRSIANFPHTPSKNRAARQMSLIARTALAEGQDK